MSADRTEKEVTLRAPLDRVWRAISNAGCDDEPTTLVEFTLTETAGGVLLRIVESGFDNIPADRRAAAFEANSGGWEAQTKLVRKHLDELVVEAVGPGAGPAAEPCGGPGRGTHRIMLAA